jgi:hypothetical protein
MSSASPMADHGKNHIAISDLTWTSTGRASMAFERNGCNSDDHRRIIYHYFRRLAKNGWKHNAGRLGARPGNKRGRWTIAVVGQTGNTAIQVTEGSGASFVILIALLILFGAAAYFTGIRHNGHDRRYRGRCRDGWHALCARRAVSASVETLSLAPTAVLRDIVFLRFPLKGRTRGICQFFKYY